MDKNSSDILTPGADEQATAGVVPEQPGTIGDIMTPAPVGVYYTQTIGETARIMRDTQVGAVLVVNEGALSGMVTEAQWGEWKPEDFRPYLDTVWEAFGPDRLMIGSDWPVCLLSGEYGPTMQIVTHFLDQFPVAEREKVLGANAIRFYRLPV